MQGEIYKATFERMYGFARPAPMEDGTLLYECTFCDASAEGGTLPHAEDCTYWTAVMAFQSPAGRSLIERSYGAALRTTD